MLVVALAIGSSVACGLGDFLGGQKSRQLPVLAVLVVSQGVGCALVSALVAVEGVSPPDLRLTLWAALSGLTELIGLFALYRGLAIGAMSVVAPISATAAVIPVTVGILTEEPLALLQAAGLALALLGVAVASQEPGDRSHDGKRLAAGTGLAVVAVVGFGAAFVGLDEASKNGVIWAVLVSRLALTLAAASALAMLRLPLAVGRAHVPGLLAMGALDVAATTLFGIASTMGLVALVSVVASLYPITTLLLARIWLGEQMARRQQAGVAASLLGVAAMAGG